MLLAVRAFMELVRYELLLKRGGFQCVYNSVRNTQVSPRAKGVDAIATVCGAVNLASCYYWKPVFCLQRAVATARLLKQSGVPATAVIGYRPSPFMSHAWVEVEGQIVNDLPDYRHMRVLDRI